MWRLPVVVLGLFLMCAGVAQAAEARVFKVYPIEAPDAGALVEAIQMVTAEGDNLVYDGKGRRLFVFAQSATHKQVVALLEMARLPAMNIRIVVDIGDIGDARRNAAGVGGDGRVIVEDGDARVDAELRAHLDMRRSESDRMTVQTLLVQNGGEAFLKVGESVPHLEWLLDYGWRHGLVTGRVVFEEVGAVLRVQARVVGEGPMVVLRLTPELSGLVDGRPERVAFTQLSTEITARDGQTVSLGGLDESTEFYSRFLVGMERSGQSRRLTLRATPTIERP